MNKKITIAIFFVLVSFTSLKALNNSIAFVYQQSGCNFQFRDSSQNVGYTPTSFFWDFGDSTTSASQHASHTYYSNRTYTVRHIISNGSKSDTAIISLIVSCQTNLPLKADFDFSILDTVPSRDVTFRNMTQGTYTSSVWDFGDANYSTQNSPTHIYSTYLTTTFNVSLLVINSNTNQRDSITKTITIYKYDSCKVFRAYFTANTDTNCLKVNFANYSHYSATNFVWDFGNGATSSSMNPSYTYTSKGSYTVKLKASNSNCADSQTQVIDVSCRTCYTVTAKIVLDVDSANPSKAKLYNYSYGIVNSHFWDFGDGNTSTSAAPTHVYTSPGKIRLMYVVRDTATCYDTAYLNFEIDSLGNIKRAKVSFTLEVIDRTNTTSVKAIATAIKSLSLYPNPVQHQLSIKNISDADLVLSVFNHLGQLITQFEVAANSSSTLNTESWSSGIYLIKDSSGGVYKVVK